MRSNRRLATLMTLVALAAGLAVAAPADAQGVVADPETWMYPQEAVDQRAPVNGCGSQGDDGVDVPDDWRGTSFTDACNWHDRCYGTKGLSQGYCDRGMLARSRDACAGDSICRGIAKVYFLGVATFGGEPYRQGQQAACDRDPRRDGRVHGDPHLVTLDGTYYSFMAAGEFAMIRDADGTDLVQARFHPESDSFTIVSGVAVRLGEREVVVQQDPETSAVTVYVDGQVITRDMAAFEEGLVELDTALVGTQQVVSVRGWDGFQVEAVVYEGRLDLSVHVPEAMWGQTSGLLGDADGDPDNDLVDANGNVITGMEAWTQVYDDAFKEAYRIERSESMFVADEDGLDYHSDEMREYPREVVSVGQFEGAQQQAARARCSATGLEGELLETCIFDVLVSGDDSYADQAARSAARARDIAHPHGATSSSSGGASGDGVILVARPPLVEAVEQGDIAEVRRLLAAGEDIDVGRESDGLTPLLTAIIMRRLDIFELLLDEGANPNAFDDRQMGPLQLAIVAGSDIEVIERLLDAGADPDTGSENGGAGAFFSPLGAAAATDNLEVAQLLLDAGADVDGPNLATVEGITPLYLAAAQAGVEMMELLLDAGADPDGGFRQGAEFGPLYGAVVASNVEAVRLLLAAGADPDGAVPSGVGIEIFTRNEEIIRLLS